MDFVTPNIIKQIEKITFLLQLMDKAGFKFDKTTSIRMAIGLARTIDELALNEITEEMLNIDSMYFLPEHWKQKTLFLKIVMESWKQMMPEDISFFQPIELHDKTFNNINQPETFKAQNIFEEIEIIIETVKQNTLKKICVFCLSNTVAKLIRLKLFPDLYTTQTIENLSQMIEIINLETADYTHNNVTITKQIPIKKHEILIIAGMNEGHSNLSQQNSYWLHNSIRKQLGLNITPDKLIFEVLINSAEKTFITFSKKINGLNARKSRLITKFTHIEPSPKTLIKLDKVNDNKRIYFDIDNPISAKSIELLLENNYDFYIKNTLGLTPFSYNNDQKNLRFLYKSLIVNFLVSNKNELENTMNAISDIDFYKYQHCKNILSWLESNYSFLQNKSKIDSIYECDFQINHEKNIKIYTKINALFEHKLYFFRMFNHKITANDIMNGTAIEPMITALIVQKNLGEDSIKELHILNMHGVSHTPVDFISIEISDKTIELFAERLRKILSNNIIENIGNIERYQYFKRVQ